MMHLLYGFRCPGGTNNIKPGITSSPCERLGNYQNSYSVEWNLARFDFAYKGDLRSIKNLEKILKQQYYWEIDRDDRGFSEWVSNQTLQQVIDKIDTIIEGHHFKVYKVPVEFLPITVDNIDKLIEYYEITNKKSHNIRAD